MYEGRYITKSLLLRIKSGTMEFTLIDAKKASRKGVNLRLQKGRSTQLQQTCQHSGL
ncbi:MAG: hypothetical protein QW745_00775 [Thermoplasmata archaeon]